MLLIMLKKHQGWPHAYLFVFVSQLMGNPPAANFPVAETFMNNVQNGASRKIKPYFQLSITHTSVCLHCCISILNKISRCGRPTTPLFIHHIHSTTVKLPAPFMHWLTMNFNRWNLFCP
jgi:hypothetical protein